MLNFVINEYFITSEYSSLFVFVLFRSDTATTEEEILDAMNSSSSPGKSDMSLSALDEEASQVEL